MNNSVLPRISILGVLVSPISMAEVLVNVSVWINRCRAHYVCCTPAHAIMDAYHDPSLRHIFNDSGLTTPDGMAVVWFLRWKGFKHVERVYGPDLMLAVCAQSAEHGYRHFFYGGATGVAEELARRLQERFPGLIVSGICSPPFRDLTPEEDQEVIAQVNASGADIVWVGIGSPRQERWMSEHVGKVNAPVLIGVGAAFDFLSGRKKQAPRWMQRSGLEWLFRLLSEPRRLWRRYAQYPLFVLLIIAQELGLYNVDPAPSELTDS